MGDILNIGEMGVGDCVEPTTIDADEEIEVRITNVMVGKTKDSAKKPNRPYLMPFFEAIEDPYAKEFSDYLPLPCEGMDEKELNTCKYDLKNFCEAFGLDISGELDTDEMRGETGTLITSYREGDRGPQNGVKRYVLMR